MTTATPPVAGESPRSATAADEVTEVAVIPVLAESVAVGKEVVAVGAVRVRIEVDVTRERVEGDFAAHEVQQLVRPVGEPASERREPYRDGDEIVIPVYEERPVVERRLFLKEEVRLRRVTRVDHREADVPVRRERAVLERRQPDGSWREVPIGAGAPLAEPMSPSPVVADGEPAPTHVHLQEREDEPDPRGGIRQP